MIYLIGLLVLFMLFVLVDVACLLACLLMDWWAGRRARIERRAALVGRMFGQRKEHGGGGSGEAGAGG